jgi:mitochondrial distribution and morphology protein 34
MSFNFNWEPLLYVDGSATPNEFYEKAKELLTTALNKPSKPPIIVDDIVVSNLNLGTEAPRLEVLEIGDIASDRFRGVFKMSYNGDACIKLSTKVQVCGMLLGYSYR